MSNELVNDPGPSTPVNSSAAGSGPGLSQLERVVDTYIAPSKTFTDILRDTSWWMPFLLMVVFSLASAYVVDKHVGFDRVSENQVHNSPKQEEAMSQLTPEQRASRMSISAKITRVTTYCAPIILLIFFAIYTLIVWASFNFGLGAKTTFMQVFAVSWYSALPYLFLSILGIITVLFGNNAEAYDIRNPVGTNLGYYMTDSAPWVKALLGSFDVLKLWSLVLMILGMAIVAKKTITQSAIVLGILWVLGTVLAVGGSAFS